MTVSKDGARPDNPILFKLLTIRWAAISIVTSTGLILVYTWRAAEHTRVGISFFLTTGLILASALGFGLAWYSLRAPQSRLGQAAGWLRNSTGANRIGPLALFYLAQIICAILLSSGWLNLRLFSEAYIGQLPLLFWLLFSSISISLFLIDSNKIIFSRWWRSNRLILKDGLALILPLIAAILVGIAANNLVLDLLRLNHSRYAANPQFTFLSGLISPLIAVDLIVLFTVLFSPKYLQNLHNLTLQITKKIGLGLGRSSFLSHHSNVAFLLALGFLALVFAFFRTGYGTNDDVQMLAVASGYIGGQPNPYLVFSNVLVGFFLLPFFQLHSPINWEIIFFFAVHFLSVWTLLNILLSRPLSPAAKMLAILVVFLFDTYFLVNITFTTTASFALIAGFCQIFSASQAQPGSKNSKSLISGGALFLVGSLLRNTAVILVLAMGLPLVVIYFRSFNLRKLGMAFLITGLCVAGCYGFDRAFVQSSPDWNAYDLFNQVRSKLQDTPRLNNGDQAVFDAVGWSSNDAVVFTDWFFPDPQTYTTDKLQYVADHLSDSRGDALTVLRSVGSVILNPFTLMYVLLALVTLQAAVIFAPTKVTTSAVFGAAAIFFGLSTYFLWKLKLPERVFVPMLASAAIFLMCLVDRRRKFQGEPPPSGTPNNFRFCGICRGWGVNVVFASCFARRKHHIYTPTTANPTEPNFIRGIEETSLVVALVVSIGLCFNLFFATSATNVQRQAIYQRILSDLNELQADDAIQPNALIVAPRLGVPLEWSNPLTFDYPAIQYLHMGWLTFSPPYQKVLDQFRIQSLPRALYERNDVYVMSRIDFVPGILKFIREHYGVPVTAKAIYAMPADISGAPNIEYQNIHLYKLTPAQEN